MNKLVLVTGVFNGLHPEHMKLLEYARDFGRLIVGINGDEYNKQKNGDLAITAEDRAYMLKCTKFVSAVEVFLENEPSNLIIKLYPNYVVKGPDYTNKLLVEEAAIEIVGAKLLFRPGDYNYSSNKLNQTRQNNHE